MSYLGTRPSNQTPTYRQVYEFTATANQTTFSVPYTVGFVSVFRNGVQLGSANFTATNGTSVVLTSGCNAGDYVRIESLFTANVQGAIPNTTGAVATSNIADGAVTAVKIASGQILPASGIAFPATQSSSADANTLDDYEEGTWTPNAFNNGSSSTWTVKIGRYTKVGNLVTCWFNCDGGNSGTAGGAILLTGLPFADIGNGNWQSLGMVTTNAYPAGLVMMQGAGGSVAQIWTSGAAQDIGQRTYISGMFTYRA